MSWNSPNVVSNLFGLERSAASPFESCLPRPRRCTMSRTATRQRTTSPATMRFMGALAQIPVYKRFPPRTDDIYQPRLDKDGRKPLFAVIAAPRSALFNGGPLPIQQRSVGARAAGPSRELASPASPVQSPPSYQGGFHGDHPYSRHHHRRKRQVHDRQALPGRPHRDACRCSRTIAGGGATANGDGADRSPPQRACKTALRRLRGALPHAVAGPAQSRGASHPHPVARAVHRPSRAASGARRHPRTVHLCAHQCWRLRDDDQSQPGRRSRIACSPRCRHIWRAWRSSPSTRDSATATSAACGGAGRCRCRRSGAASS